MLNILDVKNILKAEDIKGELPSNYEAYKKTINIAWPSALEAVLVALIGAMDMIMVGSLGKEAISAVGICNQPKYICLAPIFAVNTAGVVLIARRKGEDKPDEANDYLKVALIWTFILAFIFCGLSFIFAKQFLLLAGANYEYLDTAITYFRIVIASTFIYALGYTLSSSQRGAGYTKISMITNLSANVVNIIFNALLINGLFFFPKLGVKGAAIATAIGNIVSFIIALLSILNKNHYLYLNFKLINNFKEKCHKFFEIFKSAFGEQIILRFGFFIYAKVVASLGTTEFAAHQVVMNIMNITFSFGDGLQAANTSLVGQSLGAKRSDLAKIYSNVSLTIGRLLAYFLSASIIIFSKEICSVFTNDASVISLANVPMKILAIICFFQIQQTITIGALRGAGDVKFVTLMMTICVGLIRPFFSYFLAYTLNLGLFGAWLGCFTDQFSRFLYSRWRFKKGKWVNIKV